MKVKCPHEGCGTVMTIPDTPGIADRMLTCPVCGYRNKVAVFIAEMNKPADEDNTEVCISDTDDSIGALKVEGFVYALEEGKNIVGRKAASSLADVQLEVTDNYMSRKHVCISVTKKSDGYQHRIENLNAKNLMAINGTQIQMGEIVVLNYGDVIRLGKTNVQFVRP